MARRSGDPSNLGWASSDEEDDTRNQKRTKLTKEKLWDSFEDPPQKTQSGSSAEAQERFEKFLRIVKVIVSILVFIIILGSSITANISLLFMTSHVKIDTTVPFCDINQPDKDLKAHIPEVQRHAWLWVIFFSFAIPEFGVFLRSLRIWYFKSVEKSHIGYIALVMLIEFLHTVGLVILAINVLPNLDVIQGVMLTNCVMLIPSILVFVSRSGTENNIYFKYACDIIAIIAQLSGLVAWPIIQNKIEVWLTIPALIFVSLHWWENYVSSTSRFAFVKRISDIKQRLKYTRYINYVYVSIMKIIVFLFLTILFSRSNFVDFFADFQTGWGSHIINVNETLPILSDVPTFPNITSGPSDNPTIEEPSAHLAIFYVGLIHVLASYICYAFSKFACKIQIQTVSFSFALNLTVPMTVSILLIFCGLRATDTCYFHDVIPDYLFFIPPPVYDLDQYLLHQFSWLSIIWILSQLWITKHIWSPTSQKNAPTDDLFLMPMYNSFLIDKSLILNRRREEKDASIKKKDIIETSSRQETPEGEIDRLAKNVSDEIDPFDRIPKVFICATMWHENKEEMMEFLKSILRLDEDQCARRMAVKNILKDSDVIDSDYYDLETHIFFDDAFVIMDNKNKDGEESQQQSDGDTAPFNSYVKLLINSIEEAAREVHKTNMKIYQPARTVTPYGGRLEWTLPGRTKMIAHLKHAKKIRKKKRWSQVMYMYYLLGFKIMQLDASEERKNVISQNTFLLALDGDIDFQPQAVHLLISRMRIDDMLGAACGRIHPIGSGPMVWYQKFEYAIGHWLQKATEHVIGCVLCSPGCFSLFRGRALMENSVMRKYTTVSESARHYVQYDQGEDRWLCTLLLKQKFRVEYSAASDAYTHAPEGFNEFYNQRRRWVPSTMANIMDLLGDASSIVKKNDSISMPYIYYQMLLMIGTILGPGTIFLMMIGALVTVFSIDLWTSFLWNFFPLLIFMLVCYKFKSKYQLIAAFIISTVYALVMMAVLIGVIIQLQEDGIMSPTSLFFLAVVAQIVVTGLLHPQEMSCLFSGVIYYITIPSMYMLLVIYSLFNMNDVSWGTRENKKPPKTEEATENVKNENQSKLEKMFGFMKPNKEEEGTIDISFAGLFRCMLCTHPKSEAEKAHLIHITNQLTELGNRLHEMEVRLLGGVSEKIKDNDSDSVASSPKASPKASKTIIDDEKLPDWVLDKDIKNGDSRVLSAAELKFWEDLIEKYLKPEEKSKEERKEVQKILLELRDKWVFAFVMLNALFVLVVFLLQIKKELIHIQWPLGATNYITFDSTTYEIDIKREYMQLEPIGLLFVLFFGIILGVQFIAMLLHRFGTVSQILAATTINWYGSKKPEDTTAEAELKGTAVEIARELQRPKLEEDEEQELGNTEAIIAQRRNTVHKLMKQKANKEDWSNLENNFKRRYFGEEDLKLRRVTLKRRQTQVLLNQRRGTVMQKKNDDQNAINQINSNHVRKSQQSQPSNFIKSIEDRNSRNGHINTAFEAEDYQEGEDSPNRLSHRHRPSSVRFRSDVTNV